MGMFDYLKCEYPLLLPDSQGELMAWHRRQNDFETGDFDCLLAEHQIPRRCKAPSFSESEED